MLFDEVVSNPKWQGKDDFPSCGEWKKEINNWLLYIQSKNQLKRYVPRLNSFRTQRDETLAEMSSAYFMEVKLRHPVISWEEKTIANRDVDFVILCNASNKIYCEVKSPGWEGELEQEERLRGRQGLPKHINAESRSIDPWQNIRYAIKKSYPKFLPNCKNLLILNDDLFVHILDLPLNIDIALYEGMGIYNNEMGYFTANEIDNYNNVGGVLIWDCRLTTTMEYRCKFIANKNAKEPFSISTTIIT